ncbi:MAG: hypothetical protein QM648_05990 [Solirubrobacterales bacterium]
MRKLAAAGPGEELYNVVIGAQGAFPDFRPQLALTRSPDLRAALAELADQREAAAQQLAEQRTINTEQDARIRALETELAWYDEHHLALRENLEGSGLGRSLLSFWVALAENVKRARRVLGS